MKMKKALFITIHVGPNFGSVLQTYATEIILREHILDVSVLNYNPARVTYAGFFKRQFSKWWRVLLIPASLSMFILNRRLYGGFLKKKCHLTKPYYSIEDIKKRIPQADFYITGSDQVWNSTHNQGIDEMYYYTFLPSEKCVFSFASSFGKESIPVDECLKIKEYLDRYSHISVREKSAKILLENLGYRNVEHLLDPTLLLDRNRWKNLLIRRRRVRKPYILIFTPYNTVSKDIIYSSAKKIAAAKNLQIVTFSWTFLPEIRADRTMLFSKPEDFLSLMYYADCVITNSFHGTAFAINFNRDLWVYEPSQFSTRLISLLELTELKHRLLSDVIDEGRIMECIDYSIQNMILDQERDKAHKFINNALN